MRVGRSQRRRRPIALAPLLLCGAAPPASAMVVSPTPNLLTSLTPAPLAATDGGFTYDSVQRRLPLIVDAVIENNPAYSASLRESLCALRDEITANVPLVPLRDPSAAWSAALEPCVRAQQSWYSAPWFLVENYFYKRLLELTDGPSGGADPFAAQKAESLAGSADAFDAMLSSGLADTADLAPLVSTSLWGNVADLSLSAGASLVSPSLVASSAQSSSALLADDTAELCEAIRRCKGRTLIVVLDNCGCASLTRDFLGTYAVGLTCISTCARRTVLTCPPSPRCPGSRRSPTFSSSTVSFASPSPPRWCFTSRTVRCL